MLIKTASQSLTEQLCARFADRIRNRLLAPGARLPSVRLCAEQQGVSVSTVVAAYDQLQAQGLVVARRNRGFFVRDLMPNTPLAQAGRAQVAIKNTVNAPIDAAALIRGMFQPVSHKPQPGMGVFPSDWLETSFMPMAIRKVTSASVLKEFSLQYGEPLGDAGLRRALSQRLGALNLHAAPEQIITTVGATHALEHVQVTARADAQRTLQVHREVFAQQGLDPAWPRIIAMVVQPGVEFDHTRVVDYAPGEAADLKQLLRQHPQLVFEAHSTDYQRPEALRQLVQDGFAILKVGPGATFALREVLFALASIEEQLIDAHQRSHLPAVLESAMLGRPASWERYYRGEQPDPGAQRLLRIYSYSDRIRYYWADPTVNAAVARLLDNLSACTLPENMLSQFLPAQYQAVRAGRLAPSPHALVLDRVREAIRPYAAACGGCPDNPTRGGCHAQTHT